MHYYKTILEYAGTHYSGFQWQDGLITVQSELNRALVALIGGKITTMSASRTDTGVHALMQIVKVTSEKPINEESFVGAINKILPSDINLLSIEKTAGDFRPSVGNSSKEYRYFFTNHKIRTQSNDNQFIANLANPLDLTLMNECAEKLKGTHDFVNFYSTGSNVKTSIRTINICEISEINPHDFFKDSPIFQINKETKLVYQLKIEGDGFLKQMIRHIVSGLWMVGSGKMSKEDFLKLIDGPKAQKQLWKVAPACGLYLVKIN